MTSGSCFHFIQLVPEALDLSGKYNKQVCENYIYISIYLPLFSSIVAEALGQKNPIVLNVKFRQGGLKI
jgi:hypothetical protein